MNIKFSFLIPLFLSVLLSCSLIEDESTAESAGDSSPYDNYRLAKITMTYKPDSSSGSRMFSYDNNNCLIRCDNSLDDGYIEYKYNSENKLVKIIEKEIDSDGSESLFTSEFTYMDGLMITEKYTTSGGVDQHIKFTYNSENILIEDITYSGTECEFKTVYQIEGNLHKESSYYDCTSSGSDPDLVTWQLDEKDNYDYTSDHMISAVTTYDENGSYCAKESYDYDSDGNISSYTLNRGDTDTVTSCKYDDNSCLISYEDDEYLYEFEYEEGQHHYPGDSNTTIQYSIPRNYFDTVYYIFE